MKTVYLDHNVVHYYVAGFPSNVDEGAERRALDEIDRNRDVLRIVFSAWNLVEASREGPWDRVSLLAQFIQERDPYWIVDRRVLQLAELRTFVFSQLFHVDPSGFRRDAIAPYLSQVLHDLTPQSPVLVGERAEDYIGYMFNHHQDQQRIRDEESRTPEALNILQQARKNGHLTPKLSAQMNKEWISLSIPDRAPDEQPLTPALRAEVLAYCLGHYAELLSECPCMQSEHLLADYRTESATRKPQTQDCIDLMYMAPALAYCDVLTTHDRYLIAQVKRYAKDTGRPVVVRRLLSEIAKEFI